MAELSSLVERENMLPRNLDYKISLVQIPASGGRSLNLELTPAFNPVPVNPRIAEKIGAEKINRAI